jgi:hypothetical protein
MCLCLPKKHQYTATFCFFCILFIEIVILQRYLPVLMLNGLRTKVCNNMKKIKTEVPLFYERTIS